MKRNANKIVVVFLFLIGLTILIYPKITNGLYNVKINKLEQNYVATINNENRDNLESLYELLENENKKIFEDRQETFLNQKISYEKTLIDLTSYGFDNNIIGFLEIPSVHIKLPIYLGANAENLKQGAVHLTGTSYPIGGINTNSVIAAHRSYYKSLMFRNIDKIKIGDKLFIRNFNDILEYKAVKTDIIFPNDLNAITIVEGKDMVTIISCHPYLVDNKRYVVYFERV